MLFVTLGCASIPAPERHQTLDDLFAAVAQQVAEFGGMFLGENDETLQVYLTDVSPSKVAAVELAIVDVFGADIIPPNGIKPQQGRHGFLQLREWYTRMVGPILSAPGVTFTDIDEAKNRLGIGIEKRDVEARVVEQLEKLGIAREAVAIEVTGRIEPVSHTIQMANSPRQGGYILRRLLCNQAGVGITGGTLGFNAVRQSVPGFVTNSHNTAVWWNLDTNLGFPSAQIYQAPIYSPVHLVGEETFDPPGLPCPPQYLGMQCRFSDSAFVKYNSSVAWTQGIIARTTGLTTSISNPTLTIDHTVMFRISAPPSQPYLVGLQLSKVGATTGWAQGWIQQSNADYPQPSPFVIVGCPNTLTDPTPIVSPGILLSQYVVGHPVNDVVNGGDSGSPVFRAYNTQPQDVELYGILWGRFAGSHKQFIFSPISNIEQDLGPLDYVSHCINTPQGLVAWWPLDETSGATSFQDIITGNDATPFGSPVSAAQAPQPVSGKVDGAIHFPKFGNGLSGARVSPQGPLTTIGSADFTIDAWVTFAPGPANEPRYIVNKFDSTQDKGYAFYIMSPGIPGNERLEFKWGDGINVSTVQTIVTVIPGQWHHVAVASARNLGGNPLDIRLYVNGVQQGQQTGNPPGLSSLINTVALEIGWQPGTIDEPITIDELEIFDRALMPQEIQDIVNAGSAGKCK
ncbi:MAG TPA: LamG domain-containing protein [Thermoanaerobaculia bacterium]